MQPKESFDFTHRVQKSSQSASPRLREKSASSAAIRESDLIAEIARAAPLKWRDYAAKMGPGNARHL